MKKRLLSAILALALLSALATTGALADSETTGGGLTYEGTASYDEATSVLTITGDTTVSGTTTSDTIVIKGGTETDPVEVTLDNVSITVGNGGGNAVTIEKDGSSASYVNITLTGENRLIAHEYDDWATITHYHAISVEEDNTLTVSGEGSLTAEGSGSDLSDKGGS